MKQIILTLLLLATFGWMSAQQFPDNSLGKLKKLSKDKNSFTIETSNGTARVVVYSPEIVRIRISKGNMDSDFSYAVIGTPLICSVKLKESQDLIQLLTDSIQLDISTNPVRFTMKDSRGNLLNQDEPAFGTTWVGEEVTTFKKLQTGEKFIGLGEKTGNLDRRGEGYMNWNSDTPGLYGEPGSYICYFPILYWSA
jgi:alpha-glucosidase